MLSPLTFSFLHELYPLYKQCALLSGIEYADNPANEFPITATDNETKTEFEAIIDLSKIKFKEFNLTNYRFVESSQLDSKVLASSGNLKENDNVSSATRSFGNYSYTLILW